MSRVIAFAAFLTLTSCGIDGPPTPPAGEVSVGPAARIGVVGAL